MAYASRPNTPHPWLTGLLVCVFAAATWQSLAGSQELADASRRQLDQAVEYLQQRPYLEVSPVLRARVGGHEIAQLRQLHEEARQRSGRPPVLGLELGGQQRELDERVAKATRQLDALPARRLGVNPTQWRPDALFTYVLVHSSYFHLGGCAVLLLLIGLYLEPALGAIRMAGIATLATLGAAAGFVFTQPELDRVLVGSSGMLAGLLCVFLLELASSRKQAFYGLSVLGGLGWLLVPPALGSAVSFDHPGAHLTGFSVPELALAWVYAGGITGGVAAYGVSRLIVAQTPLRPEIPHTARTSTGGADLDAVHALRAEGREQAALKQLLALVQREPDSVDAALLLGDVAVSLGQRALALKSRLRAVRVASKRGDGLGAVRPWLDLTQREIPDDVEPALLVRMAGLLLQKDHPRAAASALQTALERAEGSSLMGVAGRVARAAKEIDPALAHDAAWTALGFIQLPFVERQELEALLAQVIPKVPGARAQVSKTGAEPDRTAPIEIDGRLRPLDVVQAVPIDLDDEGLHVATQGGLKKRILFERIEAVGVAGIKGITDRPVLVVDLVLNWMSASHETLRVVRLRGDRFNPRELVDAKTPLDALRLITMTVLERAGAVPLPNRDSVLGRPFATYPDIGRYAAQVLSAEEPLSENPS
jgi:membrane associated rhomboid family serine protease